MDSSNRTISHQPFYKWLALALFCMGAALTTIVVSAAEIYKSYDENGNVVYSDQKPSPDAEPLQLPKGNIVTSVAPTPSPPRANSANSDGLPVVLKMLSPTDEETFWGTAQSLSVSFDVQPAMRPGMRIAIYVDDRREALISSTSGTIPSIDRGTHSVHAELLDNRGNVLADVEPRTFFMKQFSTNFNN